MSEVLEPPTQRPPVIQYSNELQGRFMVTRLLWRGPHFCYELIAKEGISDPGARAAELNAVGYHIEALKRIEHTPAGHARCLTLFVMRVKHPGTGEVIAAPIPNGFGGQILQWTDSTPDSKPCPNH